MMREYETYYSLDNGRTWKFGREFETYAEAIDRAIMYCADGCHTQVRMFSGRVLLQFPDPGHGKSLTR